MTEFSKEEMVPFFVTLGYVQVGPHENVPFADVWAVMNPELRDHLIMSKGIAGWLNEQEFVDAYIDAREQILREDQ